MAGNVLSTELRVRELEERLPVAFRWFTGPTQPPVGNDEIIFWEDRDADVAKIIMRRKSRLYVFTAYPITPDSSGGGSTDVTVTILPQAHAHRHATGNSSESDVGDDPLAPYSFQWDADHLFKPTQNLIPITIDLSLTGDSTAPDAAGLNPYMWFRANDIGRVAETKIFLWLEHRLNGNNLVQNATHAVPEYNPNIQNGLGAVRVDAADQSLIFNSPPTMGSGQDFTTIIVYGVPSTLNIPLMGRDIGIPASPQLDMGLLAPGQGTNEQVNLFYAGTQRLISTTFTVATQNYHIVVIRRQSGSHSCWVDMVNRTLGTPYVESSEFIMSSIFTLDADSVAPVGSELLEIIHYQSAINDGLINGVMNYLNDLYNLGFSGSSGTSSMLLGINSGGVTKVNFDPDGQLGLGTIPTVRCHILDTTEQFRLAFDGDSYVSFTVQSDSDLLIDPQSGGNILLQTVGTGDVGINTTSPAALLHVEKADTTPQLRLAYDTSNYSNQYITSAGIHRFVATGASAQFKFEDKINLHTHGLIESNVIAGGTAFKLQMTSSGTTGFALQLRNEADNAAIFDISAGGEVAVGYNNGATVAGFNNVLMSFAYNDSSRVFNYFGGMVGKIKHTNDTLNLLRLVGFAGQVSLDVVGGVNSNLVMGISASVTCDDDVNTLSEKIVAGIFSSVSQIDTLETTVPSDVDGRTAPNNGGYSVGHDLLRGNWKHVTTYWANAQLNLAGLFGVAVPTNLPAICSAYRGAVPESTTGECWIWYGEQHISDTYTSGNSYANYHWDDPITPSVVGVLRIPWTIPLLHTYGSSPPVAGATRRTQLYFLGADQSETTGNVVGDVIFDDGSTLVGLHEHDGTAFRKLLTGVSGAIISSNNWTFNDNIQLRFGTGNDATLVYDGTNLTLNPDAIGSGDFIIAGDLQHTGTNLGFYSATPIARPSAYTQTFSTADKTHAVATGLTLTDNSGGTASQTLAAITGGGAGCENATKDAIASFADEINKMIADIADVKQLTNAIIDDLQSLGLVQ